LFIGHRRKSGRRFAPMYGSVCETFCYLQYILYAFILTINEQLRILYTMMEAISGLGKTETLTGPARRNTGLGTHTGVTLRNGLG